MICYHGYLDIEGNSIHWIEGHTIYFNGREWALRRRKGIPDEARNEPQLTLIQFLTMLKTTTSPIQREVIRTLLDLGVIKLTAKKRRRKRK